MYLQHHIAAFLLLVFTAGCSGSSDPEATPADSEENGFIPRGQEIGTAKVLVTNGGGTPLYFFEEGFEVGEPYIQTRAVGSRICGGDIMERRYAVVTTVAAGARYEAHFNGKAVRSGASRGGGGCLFLEYVAAGTYPARLCAFEENPEPFYASLDRPSLQDKPKPTRCLDFTIDVPASGESVKTVTLPGK